MRTVLVVEDGDYWWSLYRDELEGKVRLLRATSVEEAERLFDAYYLDVACIIMDGCVAKDGCMPRVGAPPNTMELVRRIRLTYVGPMIAASVDPGNWWVLVDAGCNQDYHVEKYRVPQKVLEILGL